MITSISEFKKLLYDAIGVYGQNGSIAGVDLWTRFPESKKIGSITCNGAETILRFDENHNNGYAISKATDKLKSMQHKRITEAALTEYDKFSVRDENEGNNITLDIYNGTITNSDTLHHHGTIVLEKIKIESGTTTGLRIKKIEIEPTRNIKFNEILDTAIKHVMNTAREMKLFDITAHVNELAEIDQHRETIEKVLKNNRFAYIEPLCTPDAQGKGGMYWYSF